MKSVLHIVTTIRRGGAENQLLILARQQVETGKSVSVLFLKDEPELAEEFTHYGINVVDQFSNRFPLLQAIYLRKYLKNEKFDVVHAHLPRAELLFRLTFSKCCYFFTRHNAEKFFPSAPKFVSRKLSQFVTRGDSHGIAISDAVGKFCIAEKEIRGSEKLRTIYYGYDSLVPTFEKENVGREYTFGTVARLTSQKDLPTLLEAFTRIRQIRPSLNLLIVGKGELEKELKIYADKLGVSESVTWVRHTHDVDQHLRKIQTFVLPSRYEGFGLVLLEAMNAKCAILAANNSAIPEVLGRNFPGLFITGSWDELAKLMYASLEKPFRDKLISLQDIQFMKFDPVRMESEISNYYSEAVTNLTNY